MGAHTAVRFALEHPSASRGLLLVTPGVSTPTLPGASSSAGTRSRAGCASGGVDGFVAAYDLARLRAGWRETVERVIRQRMARARAPAGGRRRARGRAALAPVRRRGASLGGDRGPDARRRQPRRRRSRAPARVARRYAEAIPGARLVVEDEGASPIAWQGGQLSRLLLDF